MTQSDQPETAPIESPDDAPTETPVADGPGLSDAASRGVEATMRGLYEVATNEIETEARRQTALSILSGTVRGKRVKKVNVESSESAAETSASDTEKNKPLTREDYGDTIPPPGTKFEVKVGDVSRIVDLQEAHIEVDGHRIKATPHNLFLTSLFLSNPGRPFTRGDIVQAGYYPRDISEEKRAAYLSSRLGIFEYDMERLLGTQTSVEKTYFNKGVCKYTWSLPSRLLDSTITPEVAQPLDVLARIIASTKGVFDSSASESIAEEVEDVSTDLVSEPEPELDEPLPVTEDVAPSVEIPTQAEVEKPAAQVEKAAETEVEEPAIVGRTVNKPKPIKKSKESDTPARAGILFNFAADKFVFGGAERPVSTDEQLVLKMLYAMDREQTVALPILAGAFKLLYPDKDPTELLHIIETLNAPSRFNNIRPFIVVSDRRTEAGQTVITVQLNPAIPRLLLAPAQRQELLKEFQPSRP